VEVGNPEDSPANTMTSAEKFILTDYLDHILQAIRRIDRYIEDVDIAEFLATEEKQDAVIRNLEVIGEAAAAIGRKYPEFIEQCPDIPLKPAYGMRNSLIHGYFKIDYQMVWNTLENDLPELKQKLLGAISNLKKGISPCPPTP
jgi:uncharacterized protein with HEPN domain